MLTEPGHVRPGLDEPSLAAYDQDHASVLTLHARSGLIAPENTSKKQRGISEDCSKFAGDCQNGSVFPAAGKLFGDVEYSAAKSKFCPRTQRLGIMAMRKNINLTAFRNPSP